MIVEIIIPAYNEEQSIVRVIDAIPKERLKRIIVVDNGSTDRTAELARAAGADVVSEPNRGYGSACLRGLQETTHSDAVAFVDGDFSDDPSELPHLLEPILNGDADLVIGSRIAGQRERGALPIHANLGNRLACFLIRRLFGHTFTDLGPFRVIRCSALERLKMRDRTWGWTVEMQAKAAIQGLRCCEVPVSYRKRIGRSKISGTILGSVKAGSKILWMIFILWMKRSSIRQMVSNVRKPDSSD